ncbi:HEAT repeat-containing protein 1 [Borealophlyctis nickersoniae]|nr:HEAT repeat-containing protein 1 [Borealophlyctis nickersoniae]
MPSSTLTEQLNKLAGARAPPTKGKVSLLFTAKQAADIDKESLFGIGRSGLAELSAQNPRFREFQETLFAESIKSFDRTLQTKEDNSKLDESILKFMRLLSPHFLQQCTLKVLEWLIRRFRVHEFNVDAVMECILPYHETKQFSQVVGILALGENSQWSFLSAIQKMKVPLDRVTLVKRCSLDHSVLEFICNMVMSTKQSDIVHKTMWSFFTCTTSQYIQSLSAVSDADIRVILPTLLALLRVPEARWADLQAAAQMILGQTAQRVSLSSDIVGTILKTASLGANSTNITSTLLFMVAICQSQEELARFPKQAFAKLLSVDTFREELVKIVRTHQTDKFFRPLIKRAILYCSEEDEVEDEEKERATEVIESLMNDGNATSRNVQILCQFLIDRFLAVGEDKGVARRFGRVLSRLQVKYPTEVDKAVELKFKSLGDPKANKQHKTLYNFVSKSFKGTMHAPVKNLQTSLYLSLQHPEAKMRLMGLKELDSLLRETNGEIPDFTEDILVDRLGDDNYEIVRYVLGMDLLPTWVSGKQLVPALRKILRSLDSNQASKLAALRVAVGVLDTADGSQFQADLKEDIVSCFLVTAARRDLCREAFSLAKEPSFPFRDLVKGCENLIPHLEAKDDAENLGKAAFEIVKLLADNLIASLALETETSFYIRSLTSDSYWMRQLAMFVLSSALPNITDAGSTTDVRLSKGTQIAPIVVKRIGEFRHQLSKTTVPDSAQALVLSAVVTADRTQAPVEFSNLLFLLQTVVANVSRPQGKDITWISDQPVDDQGVNDYKSFVSLLFRTLATANSAPWSEGMLKALFAYHLRKDSLEFCSQFWTDDELDSSVLVQAASLNIATSFISVFTDTESRVKYDFQLVVPSILVALTSQSKTVRSCALFCLKAIKNCYARCGNLDSKKKKNAPSIYAYDEFYGASSAQVQYLTADVAAKFVGALLECKDELLTDAAFLDRHIQTLLLKSDSTEKKPESYREDVLSFLATNILAMPKAYSQIKLVGMLHLIDSPSKLKILYPLLDKTLKSIVEGRVTGKAYEQSMELIALLINCFTARSVANLFSARSGRYVRIFCDMLRVSAQADPASDAKSIQQLALAQINADWFGGIAAEKRLEVFGVLVDLTFQGSQSIVHEVKALLRTLPLPVELILAQLALCQEALASNEEQPTKKAKTATSGSLDVFYRMTTLLELLEYKTNIDDKLQLVGPLFDLLGTILNAEISNAPVSMEYIKQLILSAQLSLLTAMKESGQLVEESALRVDLVVQCIRVTDNPQTHNASLLLMAAIATVYPESVLLNIIPVFTFMGASVLRQDDNYSFHVIQQTLETIIPPLIAKHRATASNNTQLVIEVKPILEVFVDALFHIPKHRRLRLFTVLITTLGEDAFLDAIIVLLLAKHTSKGSRMSTSSSAIEGLQDFSLSICQQFSIRAQQKALIGILGTLVSLPDEKPQEEGQDVQMTEPSIYDIITHLQKELRQFKLACVSFASQLLSQRSFVSKILATPVAEREPEQLRLIETLLGLIAKANTYQSECQRDGNAAGVKYCKALNKMYYETLGKANGLLPLQSFLNVISHLLQHTDMMIRRKAMDLLNEKIAALSDIGSEELHLFKKTVGEIKDIIGSKEDEENVKTLETKQAALLCLTTMVQAMGKKDIETYAGVVGVLVSDSALGHQNKQIVASSMICLTSVCLELEARILPFLPKFMPTIIAAIKAALSDKEEISADRDASLLFASLASLEAIVDTLPKFISPYVPTIVELCLHPTLQQQPEQQAANRRSVDKANDLLSLLARKVAPRILLPAIFGHLKTALGHGKASLLGIFALVGNAVAHMARTDLAQHHKELFRFFLVTFDYRRNHADKVSNEDIEQVENSIISSFLQLVMKLNETLFKPLFLKTVDWATSELLQKNGLTRKDIDARQLFFYRLLDNLLGRLKSIIAPYYGYVLDTSIAQLNATKSSKKVGSLWVYVVDSLHKCFLYDNDGLIRGEKYDKLVAPLVEQIDAVEAHGSSYMTRMTTHLVPTIGQLAVTIGSDAQWKPLNHQILLRMRSPQAPVRLVALKVLQDFYTRLGEEMLILFPETIPFLAEVMEDEDEEVERACQDLCAQIQQYLGEPIQQYFSA